MKAFVIAMENEAAVVRPFLKDDDRLYVAGVGKVNAAAAAQKAIDAGAGELINCGVACIHYCESYPDSLGEELLREAGIPLEKLPKPEGL